MFRVQYSLIVVDYHSASCTSFLTFRTHYSISFPSLSPEGQLLPKMFLCVEALRLILWRQRMKDALKSGFTSYFVSFTRGEKPKLRQNNARYHFQNLFMESHAEAIPVNVSYSVPCSSYLLLVETSLCCVTSFSSDLSLLHSSLWALSFPLQRSETRALLFRVCGRAW